MFFARQGCVSPFSRQKEWLPVELSESFVNFLAKCSLEIFLRAVSYQVLSLVP